jgi:hypothetical protein
MTEVRKGDRFVKGDKVYEVQRVKGAGVVCEVTMLDVLTKAMYVGPVSKLHESGYEHVPKAKPKAEAKPKTEAKPKAETKPKAQAKPKAEAQAKPSPEPKPRKSGRDIEIDGVTVPHVEAWLAVDIQIGGKQGPTYKAGTHGHLANLNGMLVFVVSATADIMQISAKELLLKKPS